MAIAYRIIKYAVKGTKNDNIIIIIIIIIIYTR